MQYMVSLLKDGLMVGECISAVLLSLFANIGQKKTQLRCVNHERNLRSTPFLHGRSMFEMCDETELSTGGHSRVKSLD